MDLDRYRTLLSVIDSGSLSAAASALGYTPSGISRMMAALEEETGFTLLHRTRDGVTPTKECDMLLPSIRELVYNGENLRQLTAKIKNIDVGTLTIGTAYSAYYGWLSEITSTFHDKYPGIQIKIVNGYSSELLEQLENHTVDLCIISERKGTHHWIPLKSDNMIAMVSAKHPLANRASVPMSVFETESYIDTYPGMDIDNAHIFKRCNITPNTQFSTMDIYATYAMVEAGLGISMDNAINSKLWTGNIRTLTLDPPQTITIGLAVAKQQTPASETFLSFIKKYI
ncbi:MAG: LysR family transcriptional regulator [Eubacterium sp.]|nr:LysR family transcriptional regulator [Eubacterium sp.]